MIAWVDTHQRRETGKPAPWPGFQAAPDDFMTAKDMHSHMHIHTHMHIDHED